MKRVDWCQQTRLCRNVLAGTRRFYVDISLKYVDTSTMWFQPWFTNVSSTLAKVDITSIHGRFFGIDFAFNVKVIQITIIIHFLKNWLFSQSSLKNTKILLNRAGYVINGCWNWRLFQRLVRHSTMQRQFARWDIFLNLLQICFNINNLP